MANYKDLMSQKAALEKQAAALQEQIDSARKSEHAEVVARIKSLMKEHGITLAELGAGPGRRKAEPARRSGRPKAKTARKAAVKYRNAATGDTWSGRGLRPNWLKAQLAAGRKIEDFAV